ncbi:hypothetical protein [Maribellus mangrovi]|uniref:hypothetical protein n=1 Tax=Maribellus mangrovi TaxID=3133146 RepID=UPI0030EECBD6
MKILKSQFLFALIASLVFVSGCNDDDNEEVSPFVGNYVISNAAVSESFTVITNIGDIPVDVDTDITPAIQNALLGSVTCSSADKSWVELRDGGKLAMSCEGANELDAGTWEEVSDTELKLNMNSAAIPTSPTGYSLSVTNIAAAGSNLSGNTSVPLPKEMVAAMIAPLTLADGNPDIFIVKFSIQFSKQ